MADNGLGKPKTERWRRRPVLGTLLAVAILVLPGGGGILTSTLIALVLPHPNGRIGMVAWWAATLGSSTIVVIGLERWVRRYLPLAALLKLSMLFPDHAP